MLSLALLGLVRLWIRREPIWLAGLVFCFIPGCNRFWEPDNLSGSIVMVAVCVVFLAIPRLGAAAAFLGTVLLGLAVCPGSLAVGEPRPSVASFLVLGVLGLLGLAPRKLGLWAMAFLLPMVWLFVGSGLDSRAGGPGEVLKETSVVGEPPLVQQGEVVGRRLDGKIRVLFPFSRRGELIDADPSAKVIGEPVPTYRGETVLRITPEGKFLMSPSGAQLDKLPSPDVRTGFRWENFADIWKRVEDGPQKVLHSVLIGLVVMIGSVLSSAMAAYGFVRFRTEAGTLLWYANLLTLAIPGTALVVPQFELFRTFGLLGTSVPLWLPAWFGIGSGTIMLAAFMRQLSLEPELSAKIDGASHAQIWWHIVLPRIRPALGIVALTSFATSWNGLFLPQMTYDGPGQGTVSTALAQVRADHIGRPEWVLAAAVMAMVPLILLSLVLLSLFKKATSEGRDEFVPAGRG
ncbi:MAG: carbohydrate ABC transporter permease [Armatimonadetes bacterium]|nr:carbohydrate ABC transporter permease [Armatimonadota bacterium]